MTRSSQVKSIGQSGPSIQILIKEHNRHIRLAQLLYPIFIGQSGRSSKSESKSTIDI